MSHVIHPLVLPRADKLVDGNRLTDVNDDDDDMTMMKTMMIMRMTAS